MNTATQQRTLEQLLNSGETGPDGRRFEFGFYVSVIDGSRLGLIAGPFGSHEEALAEVKPRQEAWSKIDPRSVQCSWGCSVVLS